MNALRDYQLDAISAICRGCVTHDRQLAILPTGAGKTVLFSHLAQRFQVKRKERTLILAHREELIEQAVEKLYAHTGIAADIEKASFRARLTAPVVVASVQTLQGDRLQRWPRNHFGLVVADEAHHTLADSWQNTLNHFTAKVLGVTATPGRGDKRNLGSYFQNIAYEISLAELIKRGYLSPIVTKTIPIKFDLSGVKSIAGDYDSAQLAAAIEPLLRSVVQELKACAPDRKILVFLPLIKTSKLFVQLCKEARLTAAHIDGEMEDRKEVREAFARNEFQILSNAMLLMEGYDQPDIDCIAFLRPTRSHALYCQGVGRGTRIHPGKKNLLLLDFLWLGQKHDLARPACLVAKDESQAKAMTEAASATEVQDLLDLQVEAVAAMEAALVKEMERLQRERDVKKRYKIYTVDDIAEALCRQDLFPEHWTPGESPQEGQLKMLRINRINVDGVKSKAHAQAILSVMFSRSKAGMASFTQTILLHKLGHETPATIMRPAAKEFLATKFQKAGHCAGSIYN